MNYYVAFTASKWHGQQVVSLLCTMSCLLAQKPIVYSSQFIHKSILIWFSSFVYVKWMLSLNACAIHDHVASNPFQGSFGGFRFWIFITYIISTFCLVPCILPRIVPLFEFFTHPVIPIFVHFSRQHFVKLQPVCVFSNRNVFWCWKK